jgi:hypothetical protein
MYGAAQRGWKSQAEQPAAADALQRPLRSRFQARLSRSVDMTSDVKSRLKIFYVFIRFFT